MTKEPPVPSPCINVCTIDEDTGYCRGCFRSLEEVTRWTRLTNEQKQKVVDALPERKARYGEDSPGHC